MNSINKIITTEYMKDRSDVAVVYEDGSFSHYLIKGEKKTLFDMVTMAKEYIYENNLSTAEKLIPIWKPLIYQSGDDNLISYYQSVQFELSYWRISSLNNEFSYQKLFKDNVEKLFPEYKLIDIKNDPKHIPDVWVEESGLMIPVEVKLRSFDNRSEEH